MGQLTQLSPRLTILRHTAYICCKVVRYAHSRDNIGLTHRLSTDLDRTCDGAVDRLVVREAFSSMVLGPYWKETGHPWVLPVLTSPTVPLHVL